MTRADIITIARAETRTRYPNLRRVGTRWQHQQRTLGVAVDCIGLIGAVGVRVGFDSARRWYADDTLRRYGREPDPNQLLAACDRYLVPLPLNNIDDGDVLVMAQDTAPQYPRHFAFAAHDGVRRTMIHAETANRRVVENGIDEVHWLPVRAYRFPELCK